MAESREIAFTIAIIVGLNGHIRLYNLAIPTGLPFAICQSTCKIDSFESPSIYKILLFLIKK
jgi:hypothetical protein